jgi:hypothetical protein
VASACAPLSRATAYRCLQTAWHPFPPQPSSQDHGPFNSWGRIPYTINFPNGSDSGGLKPVPDEISYNFVVAGGGANSGALDHDDGSSFYEDHHNFQVRVACG